MTNSIKYILKFSLLVIFYCINYCSVFSQEVSYSYKRYGVEDGMASSEVYCVIEDSKGYVWFGTDGGVSKFNGYEFTNYSTLDGLTDNTVFKLYEDYKGRIWYSTFSGGIGYFLNDSIYPYKYNNLILKITNKKGWITNVVVDSTETIRFNISPWGFGEITDNGKISYNNFEDEEISSHEILKANKKGGVLRAIKVNKYEHDLYFRRPFQTDCFITRTGGAFHSNSFQINAEESFFTTGNHLGYVSKDTVLFMAFNTFITSVNKDGNGRVWVCLRNNGIQIFANNMDLFSGKKPIHTVFDGFNVAEILFKNSGEMWMAVENQGVFFIYDYQFENYFSNGKERTEITALTKTDNNEIFYAIASGKIFKIDQNDNHSLIIDGYPDVNQIEVRNNQIYLSSFGPMVTNAYCNESYKANIIKGRGFCRVNKDELWVLLGAYTQQKIKNKTVFKSKDNLFFKTIVNTHNGQVWLGGNQGLFRYEMGKVVNKNKLFGDGFENLNVNIIQEIKDNLLLIITKNSGLIFLSNKNGKYSHVNFKSGLDNYFIEDVYVDDSQVFWLATNKGVIRVEFDSGYLPIITQITQLHGLPSNEVNLITGIGDYIYAGTNNGLSIFKKNDISINKIAPPLYISSIQVNELSLVPSDSMYLLNSNENDIEFYYVGLCYGSGGDLTYRYKLKEIDDKWLYTKSRSIRYPSLPPDEYEFLISVSNNDGVWSKPLKQKFKINLPFWKTNWFYLLMVVCLILLLLLIYVWRTKIHAKKVEETRLFEEQKRKIIEAKLIALRSQMNPHFTFNTLNAIQNIMINFSIKEALNYIASFSTLLRKILEKSNEMYISIEEELEMLKYYVELENLRFDNSIDFVFQVDESIAQDFTEIPSMIIQPFIENAIIHGLSSKKTGAKKVEISISQNEDEIFCIVQDNGIGRVKASEIVEKSGLKHKSLGIKITEERLKLFDTGKESKFFFKVIDCYDEKKNVTGTRVEITFKKTD